MFPALLIRQEGIPSLRHLVDKLDNLRIVRAVRSYKL